MTMRKTLWSASICLTCALLAPPPGVHAQATKKAPARGAAPRAPAGKAKPKAVQPRVQQQRTTQVRAPRQLAERPDLQVEQLSVQTEARQRRTDHYLYPFSVLVTNTGSQPVQKAFYVDIERYHEVQQRWMGLGQPNCFEVTASIPAGSSHRIQGSLRVADYDVSSKTLRLRARADWGCNREFPPQGGDVLEADENNNYSAEISLSEGYSPRVTSVSPTVALAGGEVVVSGLNFGTQAGHYVTLSKGNQRKRGKVTKWTNGVIWMRLPSNVSPGHWQVAIGTRSSRQPASNAVQLTVVQEKVCKWRDLIDTNNLLGLTNNIAIRLHTKKGRCGYENASTSTIFGQQSVLDIPNIQHRVKHLGGYRWVINDFKTKPEGVSLAHGPSAPPEQLTVVIEFESSGVELKGCFDPLGPAGWSDPGNPDIQIDDARIHAGLRLKMVGDRMDYDPVVTFSADIDPAAKAAGGVMNLVDSSWRSRVRDQVQAGVRAGLNDPTVRRQISDNLYNLIRLTTGTLAKTVVRVEFHRDGPHLFVY